jgi:hypothetical protein
MVARHALAGRAVGRFQRHVDVQVGRDEAEPRPRSAPPAAVPPAHGGQGFATPRVATKCWRTALSVQRANRRKKRGNPLE